MKRRLLRYIFIFSIIFLLSGVQIIHAENEIKLSPDMESIISRDKLIVGIYSQERPPFFMENEQGELYGLDIELAEGIADELNVDLEINRTSESYQELFEMVAEKKVDLVISKFSKTFSRAEAIKYSHPYVTFRWSVMLSSAYATQKGITEYPMHHLRVADGIKVGVMAGTSWENFAAQLFKNAKIVGFEKWSDVITALSKKEITAALYDENEVIKSLYRDPDITLFASAYILKDKKDFIAIGVPAESSQLLSWLNYYLENYDLNYSVTDIMEKFPEIYR
ncbi:MAG: substrate-binding periplasmic protein [Bacillota bacterium]